MSSMETIEDKIVDKLKGVRDPEISVNIYDLGLVYNIDIVDSKVNILMTLTSAFCPAADMIIADVKDAVESVDGINECEVDITFDPPFSPDMISEDGKLILGI